MKHTNTILAALLVVAVLYLVYGVYNLRRDLFEVYNVPDKYSYATSETPDLIVVDFNKYGCGHCRALHPILMEAIRQDGNVLYIPRTIIYGQEWEEFLATAVYAAAEQGKFAEMHSLIHQRWPINSEKVLFDSARQIGVDTQKLSRDMKNPDIKRRIQENQKFFEGWGLRRIPSLLIGKKGIFTPGDTTPTVEEVLAKFSEARS